MVGNLLNNSLKFTDPGGRVTLRLAREQGMAALTVEDTGVGIAAEVLPKLFVAFRQADTSLTNHLTKLFFAGMSDTAGLDYATRLLGHEHVPGVLGDQPGRYADPGYQRPSPAQSSQLAVMPLLITT